MIGRAFFLMLPIALVGCANEPSFIFPEKLPVGYFNSASEQAASDESRFLRSQPSRARRRNDNLTLVFPSGQSLYLKDSNEEKCRQAADAKKDSADDGTFASCVIHYRVYGYWPQKNWFLIDILYYEDSRTGVYGEAGQLARLHSRPVFSPKRSKVFSYFPGCGSDIAFVEIWDVATSSPVKFYSSGLSGQDSAGQIFDIWWENEGRVVMKVGRCEDKAPTSLLSLEQGPNGLWTWSGTPPYATDRK